MDMDQTTQLKRNISPIIMIKHKIRLYIGVYVCVPVLRYIFDSYMAGIKRQYF